MKNVLLMGFICLMTTLSAEVKVLAFAGSTRVDSYNKKLVQEAATIARELGATVQVIDLKDYPMPFYDADLEASQGMPENAKKLQNLMCESNAIIIAAPEYNGSFSAVLKNALDWASRSQESGASRSAFKGKKFAIMSASPGPGGGTRGLKHLREVITGIGGDVVPKQVSVMSAHEMFDEQDADKEELLAQLRQELQQLLGPVPKLLIT